MNSTIHAVICTPNAPDLIVTKQQISDIVRAVLVGGRAVDDAVVDAFPDARSVALSLICADVSDILVLNTRIEDTLDALDELRAIEQPEVDAPGTFPAELTARIELLKSEMTARLELLKSERSRAFPPLRLIEN